MEMRIPRLILVHGLLVSEIEKSDKALDTKKVYLAFSIFGITKLVSLPVLQPPILAVTFVASQYQCSSCQPVYLHDCSS